MGVQRPGLRDPDISGLDLYTLLQKNEKKLEMTCIDLFVIFL